MDPVSIGALALGGAQVGSSVFGAMSNAKAQEQANTDNIWLSREQANTNEHLQRLGQEFSERMSNTAYQRAAADMQKAGLNPMLAAGASESSPQGGSGSVSLAHVDPVPGVGGAVASGLASGAKDLIGLYSSFNQAQANADLARANAAKTKVDTGLDIKKGPEADASSKIFSLFNGLFDRYNNWSAKDYFGNFKKSGFGDWSNPTGEYQTDQESRPNLEWAPQN